MSFSCISDIHITSPEDAGYRLLIDFLRHPTVKKSKNILLLGDIFDLVVGEHYGYVKKYEGFFREICNLIKDGSTVYYLEGNHDFHFKKTFLKALDHLGTEQNISKRFIYKRNEFFLESGGKSFLFCHGDLLDMSNNAYRRWKSIYSSKLFAMFVTHVLPFRAVEYIGSRAAENSRERGKKAFDYEKVKNKYRRNFEDLTRKIKFDYLIAGHTHIKDQFTANGATYVNIGFPVRDAEFVHWNQLEGISRISLKEASFHERTL